MAATSASVTPGALISGWRSYVATFGLGTSRRSSPGQGVSTPPLKKYVTCAYFSVSATWNWRQPAFDAASASDGTGSGGNATRTGRPSSYRSEEHTSELQSRSDLVCRLLLEKKKTTN